MGRKQAVVMAKQKSNLTTQTESINMGKKYPCEECEYWFAHKGSLTKHPQSVQMGKKYPCDECG